MLWWRHTPASSTSREFITYSSKQGGGAVVLRMVWHCVIGNLRLLLSENKHLRKSSHAAFCPHSILWLGPCQSQPADYLTWLCLCQPMSVHSLRQSCAYALHSPTLSSSLLSTHTQPFFFFCPLRGLACNHDPPYLCLLNSQDYRHESPPPSPIFIFIFFGGTGVWTQGLMLAR
jgi:hypothetical protein